MVVECVDCNINAMAEYFVHLRGADGKAHLMHSAGDQHPGLRFMAIYVILTVLSKVATH